MHFRGGMMKGGVALDSVARRALGRSVVRSLLGGLSFKGGTARYSVLPVMRPSNVGTSLRPCSRSGAPRLARSMSTAALDPDSSEQPFPSIKIGSDGALEAKVSACGSKCKTRGFVSLAAFLLLWHARATVESAPDRDVTHSNTAPS